MEVLTQQLVNALALGGTYALLALGLALIFSILELVNFAHGELLTITGYSMFFLQAVSAPFPLVVVGGIGAALVAALLMERIAFRPFRGASGTTLLLTSFGVSVIIQILFQAFVSPRAKPVPIPAALSGPISIGSIQIGPIQLLSVVVAIGSLIGISLFLQRTRLGVSMRAAAQDFEITRLMGVRANGVVATAFAVSGLLAGIAGFLWVAQRASVDPFMGFAPVLKAFIAAIIGGLGSLSGAVLAAFFLGFIEIMTQAFLPSSVQQLREAFVWLAVIAVLLWRPEGILAGRERAS